MELNRTAKEQIAEIRAHEDLMAYISLVDYISAEDRELLCAAMSEERLWYIDNLKATIEALRRRQKAS